MIILALTGIYHFGMVKLIRFWSEMPLELRKNQYLFKDYLRKGNFADFLEIINPVIKAFDSFPYKLNHNFLILLKIILEKK